MFQVVYTLHGHQQNQAAIRVVEVFVLSTNVNFAAIRHLCQRLGVQPVVRKYVEEKMQENQ